MKGLRENVLCSTHREGIMHGAGDDGEISQEVIDEQFAIVLSRDYATLIGRYGHTYYTHQCKAFSL